MPRKPDERITQAKELYLKGQKLIEIASQLGVPEGTVRSWKNRYKWDCNVAKEKRNVAKAKKGGQLGNKNAVGGKGGAAPKQHKNEVELLERKVNVRDDEIERLNTTIKNQNVKIDDLEDKVDKLQEMVNNLKKLWDKFIMFLQNKFFSNDEKYEEIIDDLYYKDILNDKDIDKIQNNYRNKNRDDDFEL